MTRVETEAELAEIRAQIARLQGREAFLQARLSIALDDALPQPRPGWPIQRAHASGRRISTSASSRIAV